jgi:hypothetical protein
MQWHPLASEGLFTPLNIFGMLDTGTNNRLWISRLSRIIGSLCRDNSTFPHYHAKALSDFSFGEAM